MPISKLAYGKGPARADPQRIDGLPAWRAGGDLLTWPQQVPIGGVSMTRQQDVTPRRLPRRSGRYREPSRTCRQPHRRPASNRGRHRLCRPAALSGLGNRFDQLGDLHQCLCQPPGHPNRCARWAGGGVVVAIASVGPRLGGRLEQDGHGLLGDLIRLGQGLGQAPPAGDPLLYGEAWPSVKRQVTVLPPTTRLRCQ